MPRNEDTSKMENDFEVQSTLKALVWWTTSGNSQLILGCKIANANLLSLLSSTVTAEEDESVTISSKPSNS